MSKLFAGLAIVGALILFTPSASSAASKSHGIRGADQYEFSSQRYRRAHRRVVHVRPVHRPWRRAYWGGPRWGWGGGFYRPWRAAYAPGPYWGPSYGFYRPWRPYAWGRPWGWGGYRSYAWGRPWGWGHRPGVTVSFGFGRGGGWWW